MGPKSKKKKKMDLSTRRRYDSEQTLIKKPSQRRGGDAISWPPNKTEIIVDDESFAKMKCERCEDKVAVERCLDCKKNFCTECLQELHFSSRSKWTQHKTELIT